jgi:hypothetical protein
MNNQKRVMLDICYYCGEPKQPIVVEGEVMEKVNSDRGAFSKEPCSKCKRLLKAGVMIIETENGSAEVPSPIRTGRIVTITEESANSLFKGIDFKTTRALFMDRNIFGKVFDKELAKHITEGEGQNENNE